MEVLQLYWRDEIILKNHLFQHDNSLVQTAKIITAFLAKYGFDISDHDHHPYSPHLNPIQYVWVEVELKRCLYK